MDQLGAAVFYDAPGHLHGQGVGVLPLVQDGHGLSKGEVALRGVHVVDGQAVSLVGHRLVAQTEADGHLAGPAQLQGAGAGGLDVGAAVVIDGGQRLLGPVLAVGVHQGLDQQPCGGGGLDVSDGHLSGVHWVSQVLQAGGSGQVL